MVVYVTFLVIYWVVDIGGFTVIITKNMGLKLIGIYW